VNYRRSVNSRALVNWTQCRQDEAVEKGLKRDASIEKSFPQQAQKRRAEKPVNVQECVKSSLRITHITACGVARSYPWWAHSIPLAFRAIVSALRAIWIILELRKFLFCREELILKKFINRWWPYACVMQIEKYFFYYAVEVLSSVLINRVEHHMTELKNKLWLQNYIKQLQTMREQCLIYL